MQAIFRKSGEISVHKGHGENQYWSLNILNLPSGNTAVEKKQKQKKNNSYNSVMEITSRALKIIATERNFIAAKNLPCKEKRSPSSFKMDWEEVGKLSGGVMEITDPTSYGIKRKRTTQLITSAVERLKSYGIYF